MTRVGYIMFNCLRPLKMNIMRSGVYKQIVRHPWISIVCLLVCLYAILVILRPKSLKFPRFEFVVSNKGEAASPIDEIAQFLDIRIEPPDNFAVNEEGLVTVAVNFTNKGQNEIRFGKWALFFNSMPPIKPEDMDCGMNIAHVNGGLWCVIPIEGAFKGIKPDTSLLCHFHYRLSLISRTDFLPNWYVAYLDESSESKTIASTADDTLSFIGKFNSPVKWKNNPMDYFNPYTPEMRFHMNRIPDNTATRLILPTPKSLKKTSGRGVEFTPETWRVSSSNDFPKEAVYLAEKLRVILISIKDKPKRNFIELIQTDDIYDAEGYHLMVNSAEESVRISARSSAGAFYGVQTLLSILSTDGNHIPAVEIIDRPRFPYRGVMIDVARNFHSKEAILKFIDVMALYKLNKLHLHLSDDEGWRLEMPGLPELVEIGSQRCHPQSQKQCLIPSLGSGSQPTSPGSGFYTVGEYRQILRYANDRHVQIIPEIDMPGHARAAIQSMEKREESRKGEDSSKITSYLLSDSDVTAESIQNWLGNAINPCLNTTYKFVEKILDTLITLHRGIQDLKSFHFGGDEVAPGAWDNSPVCKQMFSPNEPVNSQVLKKLFVRTVAQIADRKGLNIVAWEDGMYDEGLGPYPRQEFKNKEMFVIPWSNVWERGTGGRAVEFADIGYKVILAMATHLYFDHPYEPDPEERGLHWATRFTDTRKTFGFMPEDIFANADINIFGVPYNLSLLCNNNACPKTRRPENVVGLQACLWSETIRSAAHLQYMAFPRILALAERAWHKAPWEFIDNLDERKLRRQHDWESFAKTLGEKELPRLDRMGVHYKVPIPGARLQDDVLHVNTQFPNHMIEMSTDEVTWTVINENEIKVSHRNISLRSKTRYLQRTSREVHIVGNNSPSSIYSKSNLALHISYVFSIHVIYTVINK